MSMAPAEPKLDGRPGRGRALLFIGIATAVYAAALAIVAHVPRTEARAGAVGFALTLDLVVVVPLAFYFLLVRRNGLPILTLVPVFALSAIAAARILPADQHRTLEALEVLAAPLELGLLGWIGWRAAGALASARRDDAADPLEQLRRAAFEVTRSRFAASVLASEIAVLYYAVGAWKARPHEPEGTVPFTHHRRSGHAGLVLAFLLIVSAEGLALHFLLLRWSAVVAWIFTIGTAYTALWLIGDSRATVLRPILIARDAVVIRAGLRCTLRVPLERLAGVVRQRPDFGKESVRVTFSPRRPTG